MLKIRLLVVALATLAVTSAGIASQELARSKNCVACHHPERKMIGPAFKAIAAKYAGNDASAKVLSEKVIKGGGGVWGPMPMPPQANVSPADAEALVRWILSQQ